jgi:hypothetical protein
MTKTVKPAIVSLLETKFKEKIKNAEVAFAERGTQHWRDEADEFKTKLNDLHRLWRKLGTNPVVQRMAEIASRKVTAYQDDFLIDLQGLDGELLESGFVWIVRDMGTHLHRLTGKPKAVEQAQDWAKYHFPNGIVNPEHEAYFHTTGGLHQVTRWANIPFKVTEPNAMEIIRQNDTIWYVYKAGQKVGTVHQIFANEKYLLYRGVHEVLVNQSYPSLDAAVAAVTA